MGHKSQEINDFLFFFFCWRFFYYLCTRNRYVKEHYVPIHAEYELL